MPNCCYLGKQGEMESLSIKYSSHFVYYNRTFQDTKLLIWVIIWVIHCSKSSAAEHLMPC